MGIYAAQYTPVITRVHIATVKAASYWLNRTSVGPVSAAGIP